MFLIKNVLLGIFGQPQICLIAKFCKQKQKYLNLGPEMPYLGIFGLEISKTTLIFEISSLKFVKNESLTPTVKFGIGSAFSKDPGFAFSEGLGPGNMAYFVKYAIFCGQIVKLPGFCKQMYEKIMRWNE